MSTVITLFILPIGILVFFWDKKTQKQNIDTFDAYVEKIKKSELSAPEKLAHIDKMYYNNGYNQVFLDENSLIMAKKHFNIGALLIALGAAAYFGILFYMIYYKFLLKPTEVHISLLEQ